MPVLTQSFSGSPGGMNLALPQQEIDDTEARYIQDALLDYPGLIRRRGPIRAVSNMAALPRKASGLVVTMNPRGQDRYAALTGDNANGYFTVFSDDRTTTLDLTWPHPLPTNPDAGTSTAYRLVDAKPALKGGTWVGVASDYGSLLPNHGLALWRGANKADYSDGTITVSRGSATVTGTGTSFLTNVVPGMFLFANTDDPYTDTFVGTVLSVNSNTELLLESPSPYVITAKAYTLRSLRGFMPRVSKGRITCDTNSTTVSGGATKFVSQGLGSGSWNLYRASDMTWIGKVSSVQSEMSLTLAANAAIAMADQQYIAIRGDWAAADKSVDITGSVNKTGWLTAIYAERQWFANNGAAFEKTYRLWFSDTLDPEAVDLSTDGDWIPISSTSDIPEPVRALVPTYNALLVMKESETFAVFGNSPASFSVKKIEDDGTLSTMSVQPYGAGAIWAGREGIYFFNGIEVQNLTQNKLGDVWKNSIRNFDPQRYRMWSMVARNHYFLFIEKLAPTVGIVKGTVSSTPTHWVVSINLDTRAITMHTNIGIRGAVKLPEERTESVWYLVNTASQGRVCAAEALFDEEGVDTFTTDLGVTGPDFFYESKKFNAGDDVRLKRFRQIAVHYLAQGGGLKVDTVLGLNNIGSTLSTTFPATVYTWDTLKTSVSTWTGVKNQFATWNALIQGVFAPKRVRFLKKAHHFSFRLWQENNTMQRVRIGPFHIAYKLMRGGRV